MRPPACKLYVRDFWKIDNFWINLQNFQFRYLSKGVFKLFWTATIISGQIKCSGISSGLQQTNWSLQTGLRSIGFLRLLHFLACLHFWGRTHFCDHLHFSGCLQFWGCLRIFQVISIIEVCCRKCQNISYMCGYSPNLSTC